MLFVCERMLLARKSNAFLFNPLDECIICDMLVFLQLVSFKTWRNTLAYGFLNILNSELATIKYQYPNCFILVIGYIRVYLRHLPISPHSDIDEGEGI
jgi:hypothetical protein